MKKLILLLALAVIFINIPFSALAEGAPETENISAANSSPTVPTEETHKTGDALNIIAFLLLAASALAMIFVLFPKERQF